MNDFCQALIEKNTMQLLNAPKSDIHNHSVKGCNKAWLEERLNHKFPDTPDRFDGLEGMQKWFTCSIKPYCTGAEGIILRWEGAFAEASNGNIYNVGGETLSLREAAEIIAEKFGTNVTTVPWPERDLRIESDHTYFDDTKIQALLGGTTYKRLEDFSKDI